MKPRRMPPLLAAAAVCGGGGAASAAVLRGHDHGHDRDGVASRPLRPMRDRRRRALEEGGSDAAAPPQQPEARGASGVPGYPPRPPPCSACDDVPTGWQVANGYDCATDVERLEKKCNKDGTWREMRFCRRSCYDAGSGYDGDACCGPDEVPPIRDGDEGEDPYWWHENVSDEKDVVYYQADGGGIQALSAGAGDGDGGGGGGGGPPNALGDGETAFLPQETMAAKFGGGEDDGDEGQGGRGGFSVYAVAVSNEPDTSGLPHNQTPEPTSRPTLEPTDAPATPSPVEEGMEAMSASVAGDGGDDGGEQGADEGDEGEGEQEQDEGQIWHYPMWSADSRGCASSSDPPEVYVNMMVTNQHGDKTPYLFDDVGDCCRGWFNDIYDDCVGDEERVTDMVQHVTENGNHYVEVTWDENSTADGSGADDPEGEPEPEPYLEDAEDAEDAEDTEDSHAEDPADYNLHDKDSGGTPWFRPTPDPSPAPSPSPVAPTPYPSELPNYHAAAYETASATDVLFEDSFEDGNIHYANPSEDFFTWSHRGNGRWDVHYVYEEDTFDGRTHFASIAGSGEWAVESNLMLTVGGRDDDAEDLRDVMRRGGAFISFGVKASVEFPIDTFVFKLDDKILGYWTDPSDGWERVTAYISPSDGHASHKHQLKWTYYYYGTGEDVGVDRVQLDALTIEATTGDLLVDDEKLQHLDYGTVPALDLSRHPGLGAWEVAEDPDAYEGYLVLRADTRDVVRATDALDTYHGAATMSLALVPGEWGGVLRFALRTRLGAPVDVLEVGVDGEAVLTATGRSDGWEEHEVELQPGRRVVTFAHVSNPLMLDVEELESMGRPGWSEVDGLHYVDHIDPRLLTDAPTGSPTPGPTAAPTPFSIPVQNYCAGTFDDIRDMCYTENPRTCNDGDEPCPPYTFCYGHVECEIPEGAHRWWEPTPSPTPKPVPSTVTQNYCGSDLDMVKEQCSEGTLDTCEYGDDCPIGFACWGNVECEVQSRQAPQNYCGTSLAMIRAQCASGGNLDTCNEGDEPCKSGTYCWGDVECERAEVETPVQSPAEEQTITSFLDSFFGTNAGSSSSDSTSEDQEGEGACAAGTVPVEGFPECCVADPSFLGDGACDAHPPYNTEACGYDLGDCCRESCNPDSPFKCAAKEGDPYGPFGYFCLDPRYSAINAEKCKVENREWVGDGGCDAEYNVEECGWDGGDCCRQSCDPTFAYYECGGTQPFDCKNPDIIYRADYVP